MITLRCNNCGWFAEVSENNYRDECPKCFRPLIHEVSEEFDNNVASYLDKETSIENIVKNNAVTKIREAFKRYGIERTEDKINELYDNTPKLKGYMLKVYKEIITGTIK